jgi:hypothetical protein
MTHAKLRASLIERNAEHAPEYYLLVNESQCADIASGHVPTAVMAMARTMLDWEDQDRKRAERPVQKRTKKDS